MRVRRLCVPITVETLTVFPIISETKNLVGIESVVLKNLIREKSAFEPCSLFALNRAEISCTKLFEKISCAE